MKGTWKSADGLEYLQVDPDDSAPDAPLIVGLHGRGADARDLASLAGDLFPEGYRWLFPQGPMRLELGFGMQGWEWFNFGQDVVPTLTRAREQVAQLAVDTAKGLGTPMDRVCMLGFSQGAGLSLHVALTTPDIGAAICMSGGIPVPETVDRLALVGAAQSESAINPKVLMVHGLQDQTIPIERARQAREVMERAGIAPRYHEFPMGHTITTESLAAVRAFLAEEFPPRAIK